MRFPRAQGFVLIILLVFIILMARLSSHVLMQHNRALQMQGCFADQLRQDLEIEQALLRAEEALLQQTDPLKVQHAWPPRFVPDHLGFATDQGAWLYQISVGLRERFIGVPVMPAEALARAWNGSCPLRHSIFASQKSGSPPAGSPVSTLVSTSEGMTLGATDTEQEKVLACWQWHVPENPLWRALEGYQAFKKSKAPSEDIFIVRHGRQDAVTRDGQALQATVLYRRDSHLAPGQESILYRVPVILGRATLSGAEVFYGGAWHSVLILVGEEAANGRAHLWVFELHTQAKQLPEKITAAKAVPETMVQVASKAETRVQETMHVAWPLAYRLGQRMAGCMGRDAAGRFSWILTLAKQEQGLLVDVDLAHATWSVLAVAKSGGAFEWISAVDSHTRGLIDRFYLANAQGLWRWVVDAPSLLLHRGIRSERMAVQQLPVQDPHIAELEAIASMTVHSRIYVLLNPQVPGYRLYFLAEQGQQKGLFMLEDLLSMQHQEQRSFVREQRVLGNGVTGACVLAGSFRDFFLAYHCFWIKPFSIDQLDSVHHQVEQGLLAWDLLTGQVLKRQVQNNLLPINLHRNALQMQHPALRARLLPYVQDRLGSDAVHR